MELTLYLAMLETLSDECLVEVFGRELRRRGIEGIILAMNSSGVSTMALVSPNVSEFDGLPAAQQLRRFADQLALGAQTFHGIAGDDVEGTVQPV